LQAGQVLEGYKKTKLGIVPREWKAKPLSHYLRLVERPIHMEDNSEYELITVRRAFGGVDSRGRFLGKSVLVKTQFAVKEKDFVISKRQIAHGACGVIPEELDNAIVSNEYNVFEARENLDVPFFQYFVQLPKLKRLFYLMSNGVHIEKLLFKTNDWLKQKVCMPSYLEQKKIAEILNMWDKGIKLKQKIIDEKIAQKKWLMQQLLMGKQRLPGFRGKWQKVRLGEIFAERNENGFENLELLSITSGRGIIKRNEIEVKDNSSEDKSKYKRILPNDIGYNTMRMWQGVSSVSNFVGIVSPAYTILIPSKNVNSKYMAAVFKLPQTTFIFYRHSQGLVDDTRNLKYSAFKKIFIKMPIDINEQTAIAEILSTADQEIDLLEKELAELKQQKKALMQLLLTGIVRVDT